MKAYLFIPCGERCIKKGEYYRQACTGKSYEFFQAEEDMNERLNGFEVVEPHEIEVPDDCAPTSIVARVAIYMLGILSPKKKVKKTVYLRVQNFKGKAIYSVHDGPTASTEMYPVEIEVEDE